MNEEEQKEATPGFAFVEGYYFSIMGFIAIPAKDSMLGKGGNLTVLLYRKLATPTRWYMKYRFRHYHGPAMDDPKDIRNWNFAAFNSDEGTAVKRTREWLETIGKISDKIPDFFEIKGDHHQIAKLPQPCWLHVVSMSTSA